MASPGTPLLGYLGVGEGLAEPVGAWGTSALVKRGGRGGRTGGEGWVAWGIEKVCPETARRRAALKMIRRAVQPQPAGRRHERPPGASPEVRRAAPQMPTGCSRHRPGSSVPNPDASLPGSFCWRRQIHPTPSLLSPSLVVSPHLSPCPLPPFKV